ncbi:MAG: hypothetical protein KJN62_01475 [Deltaproteobacteria bacterium]|nr:hypothetical protein [Deltaproteobacteria bacterium]
MKEKELRKIVTCGLCGKKIGASSTPIFFRVRIKQYILDLAACQRQQGLGLMLGGTLAQVMGPNEDLAKAIGEIEITVCMKCSIERRIVIYDGIF